MFSPKLKNCFLALRLKGYPFKSERLNYCHSLAASEAVKLSYNSIVPAKVDSQTPLVIIHGLFGCKYNWNSLGKALAKACKRRVVTVDCRNHGDSPHTSDMSYPLMSLDTELLMSELNIKKAVVIGHSMGGKVAMTLALSRPDLVEKLIAVDISPAKNPVASVTIPSYLKAMKSLQFDHSLPLSQVRKSAMLKLSATVADESVRQFLVSNIREEGSEYSWRVNLDSIEENLHRIASYPPCEASYQGDTLFIGGSNSNHISDGNIPEIRRLFPEFSLIYIDNAGHWVHRDQPTEFRRIVTRYLSKR